MRDGSPSCDSPISVSAIAISLASPWPEVPLEGVGDLDLVHAIHDDVPDARPPGERAVSRSQHPQPKTVLVPMRHVGREIGLGDLGCTHAAEIAGHLGIEMQRDEVVEVVFAKPLGGQSVGAEAVHGD